MMRPNPFLAAVATTTLVGREEQLDLIRRAIYPKQANSFQLILLVAGGGIGKTRLLQETYTRLGGHFFNDDSLNQPPAQINFVWDRKNVLPLPLIDLADPLLQRPFAFFNHLRGKIKAILSEEADVFMVFDRAYDVYQDARERGDTYQSIQAYSQDVQKSFEECYRELSKQHRIIWLLDTLEQLYGVPESIEHVLRHVNLNRSNLEPTTYQWLMDFIAQKPSNTTMIVAGRPLPQRWINDIQQIPLPTNQLHISNVTEFKRDEIKTYVATVAQELNQDAEERYENEAQFLSDMSQDDQAINTLTILTNGNPIRLALALYLWQSSPDNPAIFRLASLDKQKPARNNDQLSLQLNEELITSIENYYGDPLSSVLRKFFRTRLGLDPKRLTALTGASLEESISWLKEMEEFAFVKVRRAKVFLHDELYSMYSTHLEDLQQNNPQDFEATKQMLQETYTKLIDYLYGEIELINKHINQIREENPILNDQKRTQLIRLRNRRTRYKSELTHYSLYRNPEQGFYETYYLYAEQAFMGQDSDLDHYLQSQIEMFFFGALADYNRAHTGLTVEQLQTLTHAVEEERITRWVKRIIQYGRVRHAQRFAHLAKTQSVHLFGHHTPSILFMFELDAHATMAAISAGFGDSGNDDGSPISMIDILREFTSTITKLEAEVRKLPRDRPVYKRWLSTLAQCYLYLGYGYANTGSFRQAQEYYEVAKEIAETTDNLALQAEIDNDLSRILGEYGRLQDALSLCQQGLELRQRLGFDYATGLSYNTMSLINNRHIRPTPALEASRTALILFRQLNKRRGIVMASKQVAESLRRAWGLAKNIQNISMLNEAQTILEDAKLIVREDELGDSQYLRLYIEEGSLYRDRMHTKGEDKTYWFQKSCDIFKEALTIAQDQGSIYHQLDVLINLGYAHWYYNDISAGIQFLNQADQITPSIYYDFKQLRGIAGEEENKGIYYLLSKMYNLKADIAEATQNTNEAIKYRVVGTTYSTLVSPDSWYVAIHKAALTKLLETGTNEQRKEKLSLAEKLLEDYHIRALKIYPNIVADEIDYIKLRRSKTCRDYL